MHPNADCGLGCTLVNLHDFVADILPPQMTRIYSEHRIKTLMASDIIKWREPEITLYLTCGAALPWMTIKAREFLPKSDVLLKGFNYRHRDPTDLDIVVSETTESPRLGMAPMDFGNHIIPNQHLDDIVENYRNEFREELYSSCASSFRSDLYQCMANLVARSAEEAGVLDRVIRLIVVTFIMGRPITIPEEKKTAILSQLHYHTEVVSKDDDNMYSPCLINYQLKCYFSRIHNDLMSDVLTNLQRILKNSEGYENWLSAFYSVLGLAFALGHHQRTIYGSIYWTSDSENMPFKPDFRPDLACKNIDNRFFFIVSLFKHKFNRKLNPLKDLEHDWQGVLGLSGMDFVQRVVDLVQEDSKYILRRRCPRIRIDADAIYFKWICSSNVSPPGLLLTLPIIILHAFLRRFFFLSGRLHDSLRFERR